MTLLSTLVEYRDTNTTNHKFHLKPIGASQQEMVWLMELNFLKPIHKMW